MNIEPSALYWAAYWVCCALVCWWLRVLFQRVEAAEHRARDAAWRAERMGRVPPDISKRPSPPPAPPPRSVSGTPPRKGEFLTLPPGAKFEPFIDVGTFADPLARLDLSTGVVSTGPRPALKPAARPCTYCGTSSRGDRCDNCGAPKEGSNA